MSLSFSSQKNLSQDYLQAENKRWIPERLPNYLQFLFSFRFFFHDWHCFYHIEQEIMVQQRKCHIVGCVRHCWRVVCMADLMHSHLLFLSKHSGVPGLSFRHHAQQATTTAHCHPAPTDVCLLCSTGFSSVTHCLRA